MFKNNGHIHAFSSRAGVDNLLKSYFSKTLNILVSEKKMFENNGHIDIYSPGAREDTPLYTSKI